MPIIFHRGSEEFHLFNKYVSYIMKLLPNGQLGNLYYGKVVHDRDSFSYLLQKSHRSLSAYVFEEDNSFSLQYTKQEYPSYGTTDFRYPAFEIKQENGSRITCFEYQTHEIFQGKKKLQGLPATFVRDEQEAETLTITLCDKVIDTELILSYTIFRDYPVITRNAKFTNKSGQVIILNRAMSASIDFPDGEFEMIQLSGAWARERHLKTRKLEQGIQGIYSMRGISSSEHNPFIVLKRPGTDEFQGEAYGFSLIYSGNHLEQVEVDTHGMTRILTGIHPDTFEWPMGKDAVFQTPEAVLVYSDGGLNKMSQTFHQLFHKHLIHGEWSNKPRPVLINNWEATGMQFTPEKILSIAKTGKELGMELFVLDDGWFGKRDNDKAGLGDWDIINTSKLPQGICGLAEKIEQMGMKFGLWFEPESVNKDSDLYRKHPDWVISAPKRSASASRNQYVLDFSRKEVVDYIYAMMEKTLISARISYIKWDMNRYITECYSQAGEGKCQGKVFHQYILGVYDLYERLTTRFPHILFESCSSGGARFDPGILYYAPQTWTSDNTDAIERLMIQYGTSMVYPINSMGAHISAVPNQQVGRITSLETRANVALFGVFGYELDLTQLTNEEKEKIKEQITFYKEHRKLLHQGLFYRILSPFHGNEASWVIVSEDRNEAIVGYYKILNTANEGWKKLKLTGLDIDKRYIINGNKDKVFYGDELMNIGLVLENKNLSNFGSDFSSVVFYIESV